MTLTSQYAVLSLLSIFFYSFQVARNSYLDDFNYNISVKEVLDNCEADQAVYTALKLDENGFNITELLDLDQYGIYDELEKLKNITFNFGTVSVLLYEDKYDLGNIQDANCIRNYVVWRENTMLLDLDKYSMYCELEKLQSEHRLILEW